MFGDYRLQSDGILLVANTERPNRVRVVDGDSLIVVVPRWFVGMGLGGLGGYSLLVYRV